MTLISTLVVLPKILDICSVEELVSRLRSSLVYSSIIMGCLLTIDSLCRVASIDAAYFFNIPKNNPKRHIRGVNFGPVIGGTPAHAVNFFCYDKFPVTRIKIDFPRNFEILFPGCGPSNSCQIFFPDGPWASPYNKRKNLAPTPENLAKMGVKFYGVEQFQLPGGNIVAVV